MSSSLAYASPLQHTLGHLFAYFLRNPAAERTHTQTQRET